MTEHPNIFVAGFGRCGTTAMMQLLWAGDAPVAGLPPAFEDTAVKYRGKDTAGGPQYKALCNSMAVPCTENTKGRAA